MTTTNELTIVIPAKNEAKLIPRLLTSLTTQDYSKMSSTRVLVADANSTDGTPEIVMSFRDRLNVGVIRGGMPSVGRNQGAAQADTPYLLFLDADIELADRSLIRRCVERAQRDQVHCLTTNIICREGSWIDKYFTPATISSSTCRTCIVPSQPECSCFLIAENSGSSAAFTSRSCLPKTTN